MLKIHQPYIKKTKYRSRYTFTLASIGVLLLGSLVVINNSNEDYVVYAAGDTRTLSDISTMQEMTQQICSNSDEGEVTNLVDDRGSKISYKIIKMLDGACWMAENLRLMDTTINSANSDITSGSFTIPASSISVWSSSGQYSQKAYYDNDTTYGAYYNWYTATAGSGASSIDGTTGKDIAPNSICPKGWKLPGTESFHNLNSSYSGSWTIVNSKYGRIIGYSSNDAFWPAAGYVSGVSLQNAGSYGSYWSCRAFNSDNAYDLHFYSSEVSQGGHGRYLGSSVRCVAEGGLDKIEKPLFTEEKDGNVSVNVPSTLTIDATSGMAENADSGKITDGTATATISSNTSYAVTLHSTQPALKDSTVTTAEISPVSEANSVTPGNNAWGFWSNKANADGSKVYDTPIATTPQEFYNTTASSVTDKGNTTTHTYYVGISIAPSLPSGTYSTDVTITAATK